MSKSKKIVDEKVVEAYLKKFSTPELSIEKLDNNEICVYLDTSRFYICSITSPTKEFEYYNDQLKELYKVTFNNIKFTIFIDFNNS